MRVRYTRRALAQISEILATIAEEAPRVAAAFAVRIETLTALLSRHPSMGRTTDLDEVRVFAARPYPYLIFFRVDPGEAGITVLRIRHMARESDWRSGR